MKRKFILVASIIIISFVVPVLCVGTKEASLKKASKMAEMYCRNPDSGEARDFINKNPELFISALIEIVNDNKKDPSQKMIPIYFLSVAKEKRAIEPLLKCLRSNNSEMRDYAAMGLEDIGDKKIVKDLSTAWISETIDNKWEDVTYSASVRRRIASALVKFGDKESVPALLKTYNSNNSEIKYLSTVALYGILNEDIYFNEINDVLQSEDPIRAKIISWLGEIYSKKNKMIIIPLLEKYINDKDPKIRKVAKNALITIRSER